MFLFQRDEPVILIRVLEISNLVMTGRRYCVPVGAGVELPAKYGWTLMMTCTSNYAILTLTIQSSA